MSLRQLPPDQAIDTRRWRHLRYVPLTILAILVVLLTVTGVVVERTTAGAGPSAVPGIPPEPTADADEESGRLPGVCSPDVEPSGQEPWLGLEAAASEATWASHADEMTNAYVLGEDGFVFWGDIQANNFSQSVGRRYLTEDELNRWVTWFADLDTSLAAQGIPLFIVISPAKWAVYPEELPEWAQELRGSGPLDQLMAAGDALPLVDLRQPLRDEAENTPVYSRVNSHWSDYGAYVGWNAVTECISAALPQFSALEPLALEGVETTDQNNEFAPYNLTSPVPDWTTAVFAEPLSDVELRAVDAAAVVVDGTARTDLRQLPATTLTESAQSDGRLLLVRDSFGTSMSPFTQQSFAETMQVRHNIDAGPGAQPDILALATSYQPDIVVLQIAQRHLNFPPPWGPAQ